MYILCIHYMKLYVYSGKSATKLCHTSEVVNCPEGNHNWFRISRVLVSLRLLGLIDEAEIKTRAVLGLKSKPNHHPWKIGCIHLFVYIYIYIYADYIMCMYVCMFKHNIYIYIHIMYIMYSYLCILYIHTTWLDPIYEFDTFAVDDG